MRVRPDDPETMEATSVATSGRPAKRRAFLPAKLISSPLIDVFFSSHSSEGVEVPEVLGEAERVM